MPMEHRLYEDYAAFKNYETPDLKPKHIRQFDRDFWAPAFCTADTSVLEVGCGTGRFLRYLKAKGVNNITGIDQDAGLSKVMPDDVSDNFQNVAVEEFIRTHAHPGSFDRIVLFDVLEHFSPDDGLGLLKDLSPLLSAGGLFVLKLPNMSSPWGAQHQFGDLTHKAAYTPTSLRQLSIAAGLDCVSCYPQQTGSPVRRFLDPVLHGVLSKCLMSPPEIWSANFLTILRRPDGS